MSSNTLRTVEAIRAGAILEGKVHLDESSGGPVDLAIRTALLSLESLGAHRTRGAGACQVTIPGEKRTPGALLREFVTSVKRSNEKPVTVASPRKVSDDDGVTWCRLRFEADGPTCCPETPLVSNNVIRSGSMIPASAVQGMLLSRLSRADEALASACFASRTFRAWPLLPVCLPGGDSGTVPVRVDLAHRMSKVAAADGTMSFADVAIAPYRWQDQAGGSPLKASDGILLRDGAGRVRLWRSHELPRVFSAHAVHPSGRRERNLFTVEALAPMVFAGDVALPTDAFEALRDSLAGDSRVVLGRSQGVRGGGRLTLDVVDAATPAGSDWVLPGEMTRRVFVVQSPLVIPDEWEIGRAEMALARLVEESGWGKVVVDDHREGFRLTRTMATCAVRFGWNRHGLGDRVGEQNRLKAKRVILPGSVFVLREEVPLSDLATRLLRGIGEGRESGFGAVLPHPGVASEIFRPVPAIVTLTSSTSAGRDALELLTLAKDQLPSVSQVAELARRAERDSNEAVKYLEVQMGRHIRYRRVWERMSGRLHEYLAGEPGRAARALRSLQDLLGEQRSDRGSEKGQS